MLNPQLSNLKLKRVLNTCRHEAEPDGVENVEHESTNDPDEEQLGGRLPDLAGGDVMPTAVVKKRNAKRTAGGEAPKDELLVDLVNFGILQIEQFKHEIYIHERRRQLGQETEAAQPHA